MAGPHARDTIFALASGPGRAGVAVIRVSGPRSEAALQALAGHMPPARHAVLTRLRDRDGTVLDRGLTLWFPAPASFTGEDCAEFHIHGGAAVSASVLSALGRIDGCRLAEPGEFTRRAYLNGKLDLAAVEGLADLIDAQTEAQRRQALRQFEGALGAWAAVQRDTLLAALAAAESAIDFSDEADVAGDFEAEVRRRATDLGNAIATELDRSRAAARVRDGTVVTLVGPPNVGKSTLLNALARREAAIVSPYAGTTRDPVVVDLDLDGSLVTCIDTAGLRATDDPVERDGIARARARAASADLILWLSEAADPRPPDPGFAGPLWTVATKLDLSAGRPRADFCIAAPDGLGVPALVAALQRFAGGTQGAGEAGVVTRLRHRQALEHAGTRLTTLLARPEGSDLELMAEDLRGAMGALDSLMGRIGTEDILGAIFARFCVGK